MPVKTVVKHMQRSMLAGPGEATDWFLFYSIKKNQVECQMIGGGNLDRLVTPLPSPNSLHSYHLIDKTQKPGFSFTTIVVIVVHLILK